MGVANYGLAIIFMTIIIKMALYPLTNIQMKSMRGMQEIQPKMKEIQQKYSGDPEKIQSETMKLYKESGVNPLSGCLPLLIQMPILIAFYSALLKFKYVIPSHAVFIWVPNLSAPDPFYLLPILAGLTTFIQQKISTVDAKDPTQRTMLMFMPLFIGWMATRFAAGLALYWVMFNLLSILQQLYVNYSNRNRVAVGVPGNQQVVAEMDEGLEVSTEKGGKSNASGRKKRKKH